MRCSTAFLLCFFVNRILEYINCRLLHQLCVECVCLQCRCDIFMSQPFHVAEVFTGNPGKYVPLKETIRGFKMIVDGECDELPEQAFYMVGTIDEAFEKAKTLK